MSLRSIIATFPPDRRILRAELATGEAADRGALLAWLARLEDLSESDWRILEEADVVLLLRGLEKVVNHLLDAVEPELELLVGVDAYCAQLVCAQAKRGSGRLDAGEMVDRLIGLVRAFPEGWVHHSELASAVLEGLPPLQGDPAWRLWAAIEAAPELMSSLGEEPAGVVPMQALVSAGLAVVVSLAAWRKENPVRFAAAVLPPPRPYTPLVQEPLFELALARGAELVQASGENSVPDDLLLVLSGSTGELFRDGERVAWINLGSQHLVCAATPGRWRLVVGDQAWAFELEP
jgi:hypothetical protein